MKRPLALCALFCLFGGRAGAHHGYIAGPAYGIAGTPATLAAGGAYAIGSTLTLSATGTNLGQHTLVVFGRYKSGGAGGSVQLFVEFKASDGKWYPETKYNAETFVAGSDFLMDMQRFVNLYTAVGAGEEQFIITILNVYALAVRIQAAEKGAVGTPGTFAAFFMALDAQVDDAGR